MSFGAWVRPLLTTLGAAAAAGAAQLGIAYGLAILVPTADFSDPAQAAWTAHLTWVCWLAANAVVLGAMAGGWLISTAGLSRTFLSNTAVVASAAVGALVTVPLVAVPARFSDVANDASPMATTSQMAAIGVLLGAVVSVGVLMGRPMAWNVAATGGWVWLLALASVLTSFGSGSDPVVIRLGIWSTSAPPSWFLVTVPMLLAALAIGAGLAWLAKRDGRHRRLVAVCGAPGPVLIAVAYLLAGPGSQPDSSDQFIPYLAAPYTVVVGLLGSLLVAALERPDHADTETASAKHTAAQPDTAGDSEPPGTAVVPWKSPAPRAATHDTWDATGTEEPRAPRELESAEATSDWETSGATSDDDWDDARTAAAHSWDSSRAARSGIETRWSSDAGYEQPAAVESAAATDAATGEPDTYRAWRESNEATDEESSAPTRAWGVPGWSPSDGSGTWDDAGRRDVDEARDSDGSAERTAAWGTLERTRHDAPVRDRENAPSPRPQPFPRRASRALAAAGEQPDDRSADGRDSRTTEPSDTGAAEARGRHAASRYDDTVRLPDAGDSEQDYEDRGRGTRTGRHHTPDPYDTPPDFNPSDVEAPTAPSTRVLPTLPAESAASTPPEAPSEPAAPTESVASFESASPTVPAQPTASGEATRSFNTTVSAEPTRSFEPRVPAEPTRSFEPRVPAEPIRPTEPAGSAEPTVSAEPSALSDRYRSDSLASTEPAASDATASADPAIASDEPAGRSTAVPSYRHSFDSRGTGESSVDGSHQETPAPAYRQAPAATSPAETPREAGTETQADRGASKRLRSIKERLFEPAAPPSADDTAKSDDAAGDEWEDDEQWLERIKGDSLDRTRLSRDSDSLSRGTRPRVKRWSLFSDDDFVIDDKRSDDA